MLQEGVQAGIGFKSVVQNFVFSLTFLQVISNNWFILSFLKIFSCVTFPNHINKQCLSLEAYIFKIDDLAYCLYYETCTETRAVMFVFICLWRWHSG